MARLSSCLLAAVVPSVVATLPDTNPNPNDRCGISNVLVNASDSAILEDPFKTPEGLFVNGSGSWNWTLATQTSPRNDRANISYVLHLAIDSRPDFFHQDTYVECGVILHGLMYEQRVAGQGSTPRRRRAPTGYANEIEPTRDGCSNVLLGSCSMKLAQLAEDAARKYGFADGEHVRASDACVALSQLDLSITDCKGQFDTAKAWLEPFLWAGTSLNRPGCSFEPGSSSSSDTAVYSWGHSESSLSNLGAYNNLTTLIEPIITVLSQPQVGNATERWAAADVMCLRTGRHVSNGSQPAPIDVPRPSGCGRLLAPTSARNMLLAITVLLLKIFD